MTTSGDVLLEALSQWIATAERIAPLCTNRSIFEQLIEERRADGRAALKSDPSHPIVEQK